MFFVGMSASCYLARTLVIIVGADLEVLIVSHSSDRRFKLVQSSDLFYRVRVVAAIFLCTLINLDKQGQKPARLHYCTSVLYYPEK